MESENNKKIDLSIPAMTISFGTKSSNTSVANVFASKGIKTIRDLCMCSEEELVRLPTVGYGRSLHIRKFLKMYGLELGMTEDELLNGDGNPCIAVRRLAERKIPMLLICGDADQTVIFTEHGQKLAENFRAAGGDLEMHVKPGCDHHPHGLADPTPVVEFYEKCWKNAQ